MSGSTIHNYRRCRDSHPPQGQEAIEKILQGCNLNTPSSRSSFTRLTVHGFAGAVYHILARGDRREEIFREDRDRWRFLGYLAEGAERCRVKVHCYVLMENHFHQGPAIGNSCKG